MMYWGQAVNVDHVNVDVKDFADVVIEFDGDARSVGVGVYVMSDVVTIVPHVPGDAPEPLYQIACPCVTSASAFKSFIICRLDGDLLVGYSSLQEVVPSYICLFLIGGC
jgi:hypothetical protein